MSTVQAPIDSPFGYRSTALEVVEGIDLTGKTAFVTGGYSGLGTEIVRALAAANARVLVGARRLTALYGGLFTLAGAALLKLAGQIGLIDGELATQVADAYRAFRKLQHQIRLRGEDRARVDPALVSAQAHAVKQLWEQVIL